MDSQIFAIGNVLGSNIANIGLVLGIIAIIYPISLKQRFYTTDFPLLGNFNLYILFSSFLQVIKFQDLKGLFYYFQSQLFYYIYLSIKRKSISEFSDDFVRSKISISKSFLHIIFSGFLLWLGSETLIKSAISVATQFENFSKGN